MFYNLLFKLINSLKGKYFRKYYKFIGLKVKSTVRLDVKSDFIQASNISIEDYCYIGPYAYINGVGGVEIKSGTLIGPYVKILSGTHNFRSEISIPYDHIIIKGRIVISENVWIGMNVTILPGVTIGEGAIVGAGSVVTKDIAPYAIVVGNPARAVGYRDKIMYNRLKEKRSIYLKLKYKL